MQRPIFLDMDGVIADFDGGAQRWYGKKNKHPNEWAYHYREDFGMSCDEFWSGLTAEFWAGLDKTPEADILMAMIEHHNPVILSSPPVQKPFATAACIEGKMQWLKKHYPEIYKQERVLFGSCKEVCARPGAILLDDKNEHIESWNDHGGEGILVPQPWNALRYLKQNGGTLEYLQGELVTTLREDY